MRAINHGSIHKFPIPPPPPPHPHKKKVNHTTHQPIYSLGTSSTADTVTMPTPPPEYKLTKLYKQSIIYS